MRCIFCKSDSSSSRSKEHIVPESLGNRKFVLPPGIVCDKCNNYFATSVENVVLQSPFFKNLRARNGIPSKKGKVPGHQAYLVPFDDELTIRFRDDPTSIEAPPKIITHLFEKGYGTLILPPGSPPENWYFSRFLLKMAMEALTNKVRGHPGWEEFIIDNKDFDEMRDYSRFGKGPKNWPFNHRVIYSEEAYVEVDGKHESINYECDFLFPSVIAPERMDEVVVSELYFVICLYGREFAVNCGGPDIEGYKNWLRENNDVSPLYRGNTPLPIQQQ